MHLYDLKQFMDKQNIAVLSGKFWCLDPADTNIDSRDSFLYLLTERPGNTMGLADID